MKFRAKVKKVGKFYAIEIPAFDLHTQAESKGTIDLMIKDVLESVFDQKLEVTVDKPLRVTSTSEVRTFHVDPVSEIFSVILKRQRLRSGLTIKEVAKAMGSESKTAYAAYEQGKREPSATKFAKMLSVVSKDKSVEVCID